MSDLWDEILGNPAGKGDFRSWYDGHARRLGLDPDPDNPLHYYDYRAAWEAGASPGPDGHWPSQFKLEGHPRLIIDGVDTRTGKTDLWDEILSSTPPKPPRDRGIVETFAIDPLRSFGASVARLPSKALSILDFLAAPNTVPMMGPVLPPDIPGFQLDRLLTGKAREIVDPLVEKVAKPIEPPAPTSWYGELGQAVGSAAPDLALMAAAGPMGAMAIGGGLAGSQSRDEAIARGVDPGTASAKGAASAAIAAPLEMIGARYVRKAFQAVPVQQRRPFLKTIFEAVIGEGAPEAIQEQADIALEKLTGKDIDFDEWWNRTWLSAAAGSVLGGGMAGLSTLKRGSQGQGAREALERQFTTTRGLDLKTFQEIEGASNKVVADLLYGRQTATALNGAIAAAAPREARPALREAVQQYVTGSPVQLPAPVQQIAEKMRVDLDRHTQRLIDSNYLDEHQRTVLEANKGRYERRSFLTFEDPQARLAEVYQTNTWAKAREWLGREEQDLDDGQLDTLLSSLFDAYETRPGSSPGVQMIERSSLIKRADLAPEMLALLGEVEDPAVAYLKSIERTANMYHRAKMYESIVQGGMGTMFFRMKDHPPPEAFVSLKAEAKKGNKVAEELLLMQKAARPRPFEPSEDAIDLIEREQFEAEEWDLPGGGAEKAANRALVGGARFENLPSWVNEQALRDSGSIDQYLEVALGEQLETAYDEMTGDYASADRERGAMVIPGIGFSFDLGSNSHYEGVQQARERMRGELVRALVPEDATPFSAPPQAASPSLWREASAENAVALVDPSTYADSPGQAQGVYAATDPSMALGQGRGASGIVIEIDPAGLDVITPGATKPAAGFVESEGGGGERIIRSQPSAIKPNVRSVKIPNRKAKTPHEMRLRRFLQENEWEAAPDGESTVFKRPAPATIATSQRAVPTKEQLQGPRPFRPKRQSFTVETADGKTVKAQGRANIDMVPDLYVRSNLMKSFDLAMNQNPWINAKGGVLGTFAAVARTAGMAKAGLTVFQVQAQNRNLQSNVLAAMAGGHLLPGPWDNPLFKPLDGNNKPIEKSGIFTSATRAASYALRGNEMLPARVDKIHPVKAEQMKEMAVHFKRLGIGGASKSIESGEMEFFAGEGLSRLEESGSLAKRVVAAPIRFAQKAYAAGDDVAKAFIYLRERQKLLWVHKKAVAAGEVSVEQIEREAAEVVAQTAQNYERLPELVQSLRVFPGVAPFASFPAASMINLKNQAKRAFQELQVGVEPDQGSLAGRAPAGRSRVAGAARLAGIASAVYGAKVALPVIYGWGKKAVGDLLGLDLEDREEDPEEMPRLIRAQPFWSRASRHIILHQQPGKTYHIDFSYMDYFNSMEKPLLAAVRAGEFDENAWDMAIMTALEPFYAGDILPKAALEALQNENQYGGTVYPPGAPWGEKLTEGIEHVLMSFAGPLKTGKRIYKAARDEKADPNSRQSIMPLAIELMALGGPRIMITDYEDRLGQIARDSKQIMGDQRNYFNTNVRNIVYNDGSEAAQRYIDVTTAMTELQFGKIQQAFQDAIDSGVPRKVAETKLLYTTGGGLNKAEAEGIIRGTDPAELARIWGAKAVPLANRWRDKRIEVAMEIFRAKGRSPAEIQAELERLTAKYPRITG